jgi:small-conductance mechanosensitive channel
MVEEIQRQITDWFHEFLTRDLLPETIAFVIILLLGLLLGWILKRILRHLAGYFQDELALKYAPWLQQVVALSQAAVRPFSIWVVGRMGIRFFDNNGWPHEILDYIIPFFGLWLVYRLLAHIIDNWLEPERTHVWRHLILRPIMIVLILMHVVGLLDGILAYQIGVTKDVAVTVGSMLGGLLVFGLFILLGNWVRGLLRDVALPGMGTDPSIIPIVATFSGYAVIVTGVFIGLLVAGVDLTAVAVILGGLSVGIGFGLRELVNNFVSGFILLFERSLLPGDMIKTSGDTGVVEDIRLRTTHIRTFDNLELIIPNGQLLSGTLINYSQKEGSRQKRIHITIGASYNDDPHQVMAALLATAKEHPDILSNPEPQVFLTEFGDNSINYELRAWVADAKMMFGVASMLRLAIWDTFAAHQFEIPFPQRDVHLISPPEPVAVVTPPASNYENIKPIVTDSPDEVDDVD